MSKQIPVYMTEKVAEYIQTLPRQFKSKFINACVKVVIEDEALLNKAKNTMIDLPITDASSKNNFTANEVEEDKHTVGSSKKISSKKVKFKI